MAFIRWKKNKFGIRQAYLIHSYRDEQGKPKHRTLAYLGRQGALGAEHLSALKEKHGDLRIDWNGVKSSVHPAPSTEIHSLSDTELVRRLRELRRERSMSIREMVRKLNEAGAPPVVLYRSPMLMCFKLYKWLERDWRNETHSSYAHAIPIYAPYLRKALNCSV